MDWTLYSEDSPPRKGLGLSARAMVRFGSYVVRQGDSGFSAVFLCGVHINGFWRGGIKHIVGDSFINIDDAKKACEADWKKLITEEYEKTNEGIS